MKILGIDTSSESLGIALLEDERLIINSEKVHGLRHSRDLIPTIKKLLNQVSLRLRDIDGIAVSIGPGSFTGLRIGVTAAKTLSIVTGKPVTGVPTLKAIAYNAYHYPGIICPIVDARKQMIYASLYKKGKNGLKKIAGDMLLPVDKLLDEINSKTLFIGDGLKLYGKKIQRVKKEFAEFSPPQLWLPRSDTVAMLGFKKIKAGKTDNPLGLVPAYLHPKECNIRK